MMRKVFYYLGALFIHEGFHLMAGRVFYRSGIRVFFLPGGFRAAWKSSQPGYWTQCIICAFGPVGNFIAAAIFSLLKEYGEVFQELVKANIFIGLFNLIPLYPMDGGNILLIILYNCIGSNNAVRIMVRVGSGLRIFMGLLGLYALLVYRNPSLLIAILFLPGRQSIKRSVSGLNLNALIRRREKILKKGAYPVRHILVLKDVTLGETLLLLDYDRYHVIHIADKNLKIALQITEQQLLDTIISQDSGKTLEDAFNLSE
jgi:stage IV sporulation protein FB